MWEYTVPSGLLTAVYFQQFDALKGIYDCFQHKGAAKPKRCSCCLHLRWQVCVVPSLRKHDQEANRVHKQHGKQEHIQHVNTMPPSVAQYQECSVDISQQRTVLPSGIMCVCVRARSVPSLSFSVCNLKLRVCCKCIQLYVSYRVSSQPRSPSHLVGPSPLQLRLRLRVSLL